MANVNAQQQGQLGVHGQKSASSLVAFLPLFQPPCLMCVCVNHFASLFAATYEILTRCSSFVFNSDLQIINQI